MANTNNTNNNSDSNKQHNTFKAKPIFILNKVNQFNIDREEFLEKSKEEYKQLKQTLNDYHVLFFVDNKPNDKFALEYNYDVKYPDSIPDINMSELLDLVEHNLGVDSLIEQLTKVKPNNYKYINRYISFEFLFNQTNLKQLKFDDFLPTEFDINLVPIDLDSFKINRYGFETKTLHNTNILYIVDLMNYKNSSNIINKYIEFNFDKLFTEDSKTPIEVKRFVVFDFIKKPFVDYMSTSIDWDKYILNIESIDELILPDDKESQYIYVQLKENGYWKSMNVYIGKPNEIESIIRIIIDLESQRKVYTDILLKKFKTLYPEFFIIDESKIDIPENFKEMGRILQFDYVIDKKLTFENQDIPASDYFKNVTDSKNIDNVQVLNYDKFTHDLAQYGYYTEYSITNKIETTKFIIDMYVFKGNIEALNSTIFTMFSFVFPEYKQFMESLSIKPIN